MTRIVTLAALMLAGDALAGEARTYQLDASSSRLWVLVKYDRSALIAGHDHVVQASTFDGTVTWNPDDPSVCDVRISFPVTALVVDPGDTRTAAGLGGTTSDGDKAKIKENFEGKSQLHASSFPTISFQSTSCEASGAGTKVTGDLTMRGVGARVSAVMTVEAGDTFHAKGSFTGTHGQWGFSPFTALLGSLKNDDTLGFHIDVRGTPK